MALRKVIKILMALRKFTQPLSPLPHLPPKASENPWRCVKRKKKTWRVHLSLEPPVPTFPLRPAPAGTATALPATCTAGADPGQHPQTRPSVLSFIVAVHSDSVHRAVFLIIQVSIHTHGCLIAHVCSLSLLQSIEIESAKFLINAL